MPFLAAIPAIIASVAGAVGGAAAAGAGAAAGAAGAIGAGAAGAAGAIGSAAGAAGGAIGGAAGTVGSALGSAAGTVGSAIGSAAGSVGGALGIGGGSAAPVGAGTVLAPTASAAPLSIAGVGPIAGTGAAAEIGAGTVLAPAAATAASATGGGGVMGTMSHLMSLFGNTPEERIANLSDLSQVLSGASKMMKGAHANKFEERTFEPYIHSRGSAAAIPQIPSSMDAYLAAKMITEMGFGRR